VIFAILILSVLAGAVSVVVFQLDQPRRVKLITAFTGAYLMALTCLHLIPEVFHSHGNFNPTVLGGFILGGFLLQVVLDNFSGGIEHGHAHHTAGSIPFAMMAGLCVHAFLEAMPLHAEHGHGHSQLLVAIAVHKFPVSIVLLGMLLKSGQTRGKSFALLAVFGVMAPIGAALGTIPAISRQAPYLLALVIGIFMHVSTTILFESGEGHHYNRRKALAIALGAGIAVAGVLLATPHHHHH